MGNIRPSFIKIRAIRLCEEHGEKFTDDFDHNKLMVAQLTDVESKNSAIGLPVMSLATDNDVPIDGVSGVHSRGLESTTCQRSCRRRRCLASPYSLPTSATQPQETLHCDARQRIRRALVLPLPGMRPKVDSILR